MKPKVAMPLALAGICATIGTSVANANGLFSGHPNLAYWFYGGSILLIAIAAAGAVVDRVRSRKSLQSPSTFPPTPINPVNITISDVGNVGARSASLNPPLPTVSQAVPPKRSANIRFVGIGKIDVHEGIPDGVFYESKGQGPVSFPAFVACFRNQSRVVGQPVREPFVQAHIIYKDNQGNEIADVPQAVWIDHRSDSIQFEEGVKKCVVIFVSHRDNRTIVWSESRYTSWGSESFSTSGKEAPPEIASVELSLVRDSQGDVTCLKQMTFKVINHDSADKLPSLERVTEEDPPE